MQPQVRCINVGNTENLANESSLQTEIPFFIIEIIVYRKECDWCYWWQDTASDDHRSCCFNGSVSDENKKQLDPFFDADRVRI